MLILAARQHAAVRRMGRGARWIPASGSGTADDRVPSLRAFKVTSNVASLGRRDRGGRAAIRSRCAGVSRRVPVPFNSYWRRAPRRARDSILGGDWSGGCDGANRGRRQECQD